MTYIKLSNKGNGVVNVNTFLTEFSYGGVTHKNRTDRYGIREGFSVQNVKYKINNGSWVNMGTNQNFDVKLNKNGDRLDVAVQYRYDTQGYHHKNSALPFFYYTDQRGVVADAPSYKTNGACPWIFNLNSARTICKLPNNWTPISGGKSNVSIVWTDWAKSHANTSDKLWWHSGPQHEQRNAKYFGTYGEGWFSMQGRWNYYRRSCLWKWECNDTASIIVNNVAPPQPGKPTRPTLKIFDAYGNGGYVELTNNDSSQGYMKLGAWVKELNNGPNVDGTWRWIINGKSGLVAPNTGLGGSKWGPGATHKVYVDFDSIWGEQYSAKDIYYQLSMVNDANIESDYASSNGKQHYNARPTIPKVILSKSGTTLNGSWSSTDPDPRNYSTEALPASLLTYDVVLNVSQPTKGSTNTNLFTKTQSTSTTIDATKYEEGSTFVLKVRSHDGRIYSKDWGSSNQAQQGYKAIAPQIVYPLENKTVYNTTPRIVIMTDAKGSNDVLVCTYNGRTYRSDTDTSCFSSRYIPRGVNFMIFRPSSGSTGNQTVTAKSVNEDSTSYERSRIFNVGTLSLSLSSGKYIEEDDFMPLEKPISDVRNAYGLSEFYTEGTKDYIEAKDINAYTKNLVDIDNSIRSLNPSLAPDINTTIKTGRVSYIDADDFNYIISDLKEM